MTFSLLLSSSMPLPAEVTLSFAHDNPVEPTGLYFILDGAGFPEDQDSTRAKGPWWAQIVDIGEIAPEGTPPLMMIASTDHFHTSNPDAGLYVWRADRPAGPWTFDGQFFSGSPHYPQMEAPTARVLIDPEDGQKKLFIWAHYVPTPYLSEGPLAHRQVSIALVSDDGVAQPLPLVDTALDAARAQFDLTDEPYNAHFGYLNVGPNVFSGLVNPKTGEPWPYIGGSMYGSLASENRMFGMALWGLETPRDAPTLIERSIRDSRFIYKAPSRMITTSDIGASFKDLDGTLWGMFTTSGPGGFEIRAVEMDRWGLVTSRANALFDGTMINPADFPEPFTKDAVMTSPQWLSAYRGKDGQIWAVLTVVLREDLRADRNMVLIIPLGGSRAPDFETDRPARLRFLAQQTSLLQPDLPGVHGTAGVDWGDPAISISPGTEWEFLTWDTDEPLSQYQLLRFQLNGFGEGGDPVSPNTSDFWVFATPLDDVSSPTVPTDFPLEGFTVGAGATDGSKVYFGALTSGTQPGDLELSRYLSIGRGVGNVNWRYDLGLAIWPQDRLFGVTHSGEGLVETVGNNALDVSKRWRFGIATRQHAPTDPDHATHINNVTLTAVPINFTPP